ncbi:DUF4276 family protein [Paludibaculum fermentans]|uniref:DUF4276 family protein n=1 Tax=Paludibaculum fermentans TaxID=1473598 RepID=UPI003EB7BF85
MEPSYISTEYEVVLIAVSSATIVPIVEGQGEVEAVPILLRRLSAELCPSLHLKVEKPIRSSRDKIVLPGKLEAVVALAAAKLQGPGAILILLDSDGACPKELGPSLLTRARAARADKHIRVALAHQEYEAWFLASADSLAGKRGFPNDLQSHPEPETVQGAKQWLSKKMLGSSIYSPTVDQPALTSIFELNLARRARSFDRFYHVCEDLFASLLVEQGHQQEDPT